MKLTIFGATGGTGRLLVEQALAAGHDVTAFVRSPAKLSVQNPMLHVVQGSIFDCAAVEQVIAGSDAVISALGPRSNDPVLDITRGMTIVIAAMQKCGARRLVVTAGMDAPFPKDRPAALDRMIRLMLNLMARNAGQDLRNAVELVEGSGLDWTVVRAPRLTDKPGGEALKVGYVGLGVSWELARADFALVLLQAAEQNKWLHDMPAVSD
jgi:putative NADH-flavin reductase